MQDIYLDNSATTKPCAASVEAAVNAMNDTWGNPSSLHSRGKKAAELVHTCRNEIFTALLGKNIASKLPKRPGLITPSGIGRLIFTASGTESDNLAITGIIRSCKVKNPRVITTDSEHPAVLNTLSELEKDGAEVYKLSTVNGVIDMEEFKKALTPNTVLITIMAVNNETGAIYELKELFSYAKRMLPNVICHSDCVQAFQKIGFTPDTLGADMVTVSGHKVHAPKGIGALYVSDALIKKKRPFPIIHGGGQEDFFRSGTESVPLIAAFAAAVKANGSDGAHISFTEKTALLRKTLSDNLPSGVRINTPLGKYVPHIVSLTLPVKKSQPVLNFLSSEGIYVSSGSACSSHKDTVSHVLTAFGLSHDDADRTIRVSFDTKNTVDDVLLFCDALKRAIEKLGKDFKR